MPNIIAKIFPSLNKEQIHLSPLGESRTDALTNKITQLAKTLHISDIQFYRLDKIPFFSGFAGVKSQDKLEFLYSYFLLIESEDIPAPLQPRDPLDPRINDDSYLFEVGAIIADKFGCPRFTLNWKEKVVFRTMLRLLANPERFQAAKNFIIGHEVSHLYYRHTEAVFEKNRQVSPVFIIPSLAISTIVFKKFVSSLGKHFPVRLILITFGSYFLSVLIFNLIHIFHLRRQIELEADAKAVSLFGKEGAFYFFEAIRVDPALKPTLLSRFNPYRRFIAPLFHSHPPLHCRIHHIHTPRSTASSA